MRRKKPIDPIPEEFACVEEAAEFWATHDTADYPDAFRTVNVTGDLRTRRYEIEIDGDVVRALRARARRKRETVGHLASRLLRERLSVSR